MARKVILISNPICVDSLACNTVVLEYSDTKDVFNFLWTEAPSGFKQKVRIPAALRNTSHPSDSSFYQKSNGSFQITSARNNKKKELVTDWVDEIFTDAFSDARFHKNMWIDSVKYSGHAELTEETNEEDNLVQIVLAVYAQEYDHSNISC